MINLNKNYKVEQKISKGDGQGLDKENLSRHVGTSKTFSVKYDTLTGKFKTGLDEFSPEVLTLPEEEQKKEVEWIRVTKDRLETLIGKKGILDANNEDFWSVWKVDLEVGQDKKVKLFGSHPNFEPNVNWQHALALITIQANKSIPMSSKDLGNPIYRDSQFYITTDEEEVSHTKDKLRTTRERAKLMYDLFDGKGQYERASRIAYLMNVQKDPVGIEKLEEVLEMFSVLPTHIDNFIKLAKMEDDELLTRTMVKQAIELGVIKFNSSDRLLYRGNVNFRPTENETVEYLRVNQADPVLGREYVEIQQAVNKLLSKKKQKTIVTV